MPVNTSSLAPYARRLAETVLPKRPEARCSPSTLRLESSAGGITLTLCVDPSTHRIDAAFFAAHTAVAPEVPLIASNLCGILEGLPILEAQNHAVLKLEESLRDSWYRRSVPGIDAFLEDCAEMGVKAISLVSDGESSISPHFEHTIIRGSQLGISMAAATHGYNSTRESLEKILPHLTYLRVNISAGEPARYAQIMGVKEEWFHQVCRNIRDMVDIKKRDNLDVTIGMQMVLMPQDADQVIPLAKLGKELRPDYLVIKHTSDSEDGQLGVDYSKYAELDDLLHEAESYSDGEYQVSVKWSKISSEGKRSYQRCYGPPFQIQISGSGLVAPCGMLFNERYKKFHIGNIVTTRFKDIVQSDRYWDVMNYLASPRFNAQKMCGSLCLQHKPNEFLDAYKKGLIDLRKPQGNPPQHINFI